MRSLSARFAAPAVGAVLAWAATPAVLWAAPSGPPAPAKDDKALSPIQKLHADLDKTISIKFTNQTLAIAVAMLHDKTGIHFVFDTVIIQQQLGFIPDQTPTPVEVDAKDQKVRDVLRAVITPYGLSYAAIGDTVLITTEDQAMYRQMHQRVTVDLNKVEFATALKQLAKETRTNLTLDPRAEKEATGKVTLQLEDDIELDTAVRLLAEEAGLKAIRIGNVLFVTTPTIAGQLRSDPDLAQPTQPGQPVPPVFANPPGLPVAPPPVITVPVNPPPGVAPPAVDPTANPPDVKPPDPNVVPDKKEGDK